MSEGQSPFEHGRYRYSRVGVESSPPEPRAGDKRGRGGRGKRIFDRILGVVLGLVLGIAIVAAFLFLGGEETIDAPRIEERPPTNEAPVTPGRPSPGDRSR